VLELRFSRLELSGTTHDLVVQRLGLLEFGDGEIGVQEPGRLVNQGVVRGGLEVLDVGGQVTGEFAEIAIQGLVPGTFAFEPSLVGGKLALVSTTDAVALPAVSVKARRSSRRRRRRAGGSS
jgi:hypothetical protein